MSKHLLLAERDLIDFLKNKDVIEYAELSNVMNFNTKFLMVLVKCLQDKNIIDIGQYNSLKINESEIQKINCDSSIVKEELKDIQSDLVDAYFDRREFVSDLIVRGFWMSDFERKVFASKKADFLGFIQSLSKNTPGKNKVKHLISFAACDFRKLSRYPRKWI